MNLPAPHMSEASARQSVERARTHLEAAAEEVVRQINGRAWLALGYESWDDMREAEYRGAAVIVPRADRPELVAKLRAEGLSQKQIGNTVGVSEATVSRNLQMKDTEQPPTRLDSLGRERPTTYAPRAQGNDLPQVSGAVDTPAAVVEDLGGPAPSASDMDGALAESLAESADYQTAEYRRHLSRELAQVTRLALHDPSRVVEVGDATTFEVIDNACRSIAAWHERIKKLRDRPLRVVGGGQS